MLGLKLIHVSNRGPWYPINLLKSRDFKIIKWSTKCGMKLPIHALISKPMEVNAWMSKYTLQKVWHAITYTCPNRKQYINKSNHVIAQMPVKQFWRTGGRFNIKMSSYQYRDPHVKDKTVSRPFYSLTWESPYLGKTVLNWDGAKVHMVKITPWIQGGMITWPNQNNHIIIWDRLEQTVVHATKLAFCWGCFYCNYCVVTWVLSRFRSPVFRLSVQQLLQVYNIHSNHCKPNCTTR